MPTSIVPAVASSTAGTTVSGQVLDERTYRITQVIPRDLPPVAGATVRILDLGLVTTTDFRGHFSFNGVAPDRPYRSVTIQVEKPDYGKWQIVGAPIRPDGLILTVELTGKPQTINYTPRERRTSAPVGTGPPVDSPCSGYYSDWVPPSSIVVGLTFSKATPPGPVQQVKTYDFNFYVKHVLPNEWMASWPADSLEAGAIAVKNYGWYWTNWWRGGTFNGQCYDVDDSTNYQVFDATASDIRTDQAVDAAWSRLLQQNGTLFEANYQATLTGNTGEGCGTAANGSVMSQWGTNQCANNGKTWPQIINTYYFPNITIPTSYVVNDSRDAAQASAGTSCASTLGTCTLRAAVQAADQSSSNVRVTVPAGTYSLSIAEGSVDDASGGDLHLSGSVTLVGAGQQATIIQNTSYPADRIFNVESGATVTISGLTVQNGTSLTGYGGGIVNAGNLTLNGLTVSGNAADAGGGGVSNLSGSLTLSGVAVSQNSAPEGGGISLDGVGGTLNVTGSRITSNLANSRTLSSFGGGIAVNSSGAAVTIDHSAVSGNTSLGGLGTGAGGGIAISSTNDTVTLTNDSITSNSVSGGSQGAADGGGIVNEGGGGTSLTLTNSTVSGNAASGTGTYARGGGLSSSTSGSLITVSGSTISSNLLSSDSIFSRGAGIDLSGADSASISNSTISGNSATGPTGVTTVGGGLAVGGRSAGHLDFSTVDGNAASTGSGLFNTPNSALTSSNTVIAGDPSGNCSGLITDQGYNLDSGFSCGLTGTGDISGSDAGLNSLSNNGGPTMTEAPATGSPLIDAANPSCPPPGTDQRGAARPYPAGGRCDMGSVEFGATVPSGGGSISILTARSSAEESSITTASAESAARSIE